MNTHKFLITTVLSAGFALSLIPSVYADSAVNYDVVHDTGGSIVRSIAFGNCVRTRWASESDECASTPEVAQAQEEPRAAAPQRVQHTQIAEEERTVYFEFNKTRLMDSERRKLEGLASTLKSMNDIQGVSIAGYADRIGTTGYNERLSQKRAEVIESYLREQGYLNTSIAKTRWLGETVPVTSCPSDMKRSELITCLQKDRRVTVEIKYEEDTPSASGGAI